jgi:hypothetical protein
MGEDAIRDDGRDARLTVAAAAERLGITKEAVRKRISRGTLRSDKDTDGTVRVYIPTSRTSSGTASEAIGRDELVELLRAQLEDLRADRDAWRDQARRSDYMASAAMDRTRELESRIRELEAPSEARESPEPVEEEPERAEPRPATEGAQEGTERPQQRSGWLAPVDKLPWWHYVLGLFLVFSGGFLPLTLERMTNFVEVPISILLAIAWSPPGFFGFWVAYRKRNLRLWSQVLPLGALVGGVAWLGLERGDYASFSWAAGPYLLVVFFPAWLLFVSASLLGNTWQRRRIGRISGTTPASPVSRTRQRAAQQPRKDLTPAQQAMLGWGGTIISALITLVGTIIAVRGGS